MSTPSTPSTPTPESAETGDAATGTLSGKMGSVAAASAIALLAGQLISLGQTVALARLLSPEEVGYFAAGSVTTSFITNVVEGGLRAGLIHRKDRIDDAAETVFRATLATGLLMTLLTLAAAPLIAALFSSRTAGIVAASMAGGIFLFAFTNVPEALLQREFSVKRRLVVGPTVAVTFAVVSVTLAALGAGVWSLVIGTYASTAVWVLTLWLICDWRPGRGRADAAMYREMVSYGAPLAIGAFVEQALKTVQAVVTGRVLGVHSLGLFRYGDRIAQIPVGVIVDVGANSLFPAYSRIADDRDRFRASYLRALSLVTVVGAGMSAGLLAVGQPLVVIVLGEEWRGAGVVLVTMAGLGLGTALSTSSEAIKGAGRTTLLNWTTALEVLLGVSLILVLVPTLGLPGVGLSISATVLLVGVAVLCIARSILDVPWGRLLAAIVPTTLAATATAGAVFALETWVFDSPARSLLVGLGLLVVDGVVFAAVYAALLRLLAPASARLVWEVARSGAGAIRRQVG